MCGPQVWDLMKAVAARSAAVIRFGLTSVEHMEPETSKASMIVADDDATGPVACGRGAPTLRRVSHATANTSGMTRSTSSAHGQDSVIQATAFGPAPFRPPGPSGLR